MAKCVIYLCSYDHQPAAIGTSPYVISTNDQTKIALEEEERERYSVEGK
jgi:hypothetical protein